MLKFAEKSDMLFTIKKLQITVKAMKMIQTLNLRQKNIKSSLCDCLDQYIFETGDLTATFRNADTDIGFKNCALFKKCMNHINDQHIDTAEEIDVTMSMYNLIEYCDNYPDTFGK